MTPATVILDSYDNILVSPAFLKTWGPQNGYDVQGMCGYAWGASTSLCTGAPGNIWPAAGAHQWLDELTAAGMGVLLTYEGLANAPSVLGGPGGERYATILLESAVALKAPKGAGLCLNNDAVVTDEDNVIAFYQASDALIRGEGFEPTGYMQSSVYETLLAYGIEWLWHAPDGTVGPPWPKGTVLAQRADFYVNPQGYECDVDDVIATPWGGWNLDGLFPAPDPPKETDVFLFHSTADAGTKYLCCGRGSIHLDPADYNAFKAANVPEVGVTPALFALLTAG